MSSVVGIVQSIWQYPVSSCAGVRLEAATLRPDGVEGDRRYGLVDPAANETSAPERKRRWHATPTVMARYGADGGVHVSLNDTDWHDADDEVMRAELRAHFGFDVVIRPYGPSSLDGQFAVERYPREPLHVLTTAGLDHLRAALPGSSIDERRFRPNIVIDTAPDVQGYAEDEWIGRKLLIGPSVIEILRPCPRCAMTTMAVPGQSHDRAILSELIRSNERDFGVLCSVPTGGRISVGQEVVLH